MILQLLRLFNILACIPWIPSAVRLILVARHMRDNSRSRFGWAFGLIAWGILALYLGNTMVFGFLFLSRAPTSLWPGLIPPVMNFCVGLGVSLLTKVSTEED